MRLRKGQFWGAFWLLTLFIAGLITWFLSNLLYTLFWKLLGDWGVPITEGQMITYIAANLVPFVLVLFAAAALAKLIRDHTVFVDANPADEATSPVQRRSNPGKDLGKPTQPPTSAGIELASIGLIPPEGVTLVDEIVVQSVAIVFLNLANSEGKESLFRRSWNALPNGCPGKRRFSYHQYFVAVENKSNNKTLRGVRLVAEILHGLGGQILNREFLCERTGTGSVDIPPKGKDYYLIGEGIDDSLAGTFHCKIVAPDEYDRILADIEQRDRQHIGFILSTSKGQKYSLLKNDDYRLSISAYADDNPPAVGTLVINAKTRIQLWLTEGADASAKR